MILAEQRPWLTSARRMQEPWLIRFPGREVTAVNRHAIDRRDVQGDR